MSSQPFKTDSLLPTSLPSASLGRRRQFQAQTIADEDSLTAEERAQKALDGEHEKWNERIDKEIKGVTTGLKELVDLADIGTSPSPLISSTLPLHLPLRTSSLIRSAQNLRDIAHELKLLLLLGDEQGIAQRRDEEFRQVRKNVDSRREEVKKEVGELLGFSSQVETGEESSKQGGQGKVGPQESRSLDQSPQSDKEEKTEEKRNAIIDLDVVGKEAQQTQSINIEEQDKSQPQIELDPSSDAEQIAPVQVQVDSAADAQQPSPRVDQISSNLQIDTQSPTANLQSTDIPEISENTSSERVKAADEGMDVDKDDEDEEEDFEEVS
ncbi:uncharacterized protein IL334_000886 [Kwoniella shivajii]|uniref:Uncharacterized protein n=1 Tax=Kwoniella shivajii TaxID=564305 RepID=A0ABZ1CRH0_9TREE|nr:hypothetical protein IL334_000886 [Kwoniella shivajii]